MGIALHFGVREHTDIHTGIHTHTHTHLSTYMKHALGLEDVSVF